MSMRKNLLFTAVIALCGFVGLHAQTQIPNSNFELWENVGSNTEEPNDWNGLKTGSGSLAGLAPKTIQRSTTIRPGTTGQYSARAFTVNSFGTNANGNLTVGRVNAASTTPTNSSNYNYTVTNDAAFNATMTDWPDSLVFWAKYNPASQSSQARVRAVIHDNYSYRDPSASDVNSPSHVVANATLNFSSNNNVWQRISVPFDYSGPATVPAFFLITFTSNMTAGGGSAGDEVFIDDMSLIYNPVTTSTSTISPLSYNVSATQGASISIPFTKTGIFHAGNVFTAQLSDASGSFASPITLGTLVSTSAGTISGTIPAGTPSGSGYRVRVVATTPYQTATPNTSNITINLVSTSITPTATQTIVANTNGTLLTATESVSSTSREWKFATVSGGPYSSFSPSETGTTYIPNFDNAGTYYVVCESTFGSLSARSNEVIVNVVKNQITPAGSQSLLVANPGTTLTVTETPASTSREWVYANTSGGPYVSFAPIETGATYQPLFNSSGTYYVVCKSVISGLTATSNEVVISVGNLNITTGTITGSPFEFSASAPNANVSVPYTVSGSFNGGNTFTAQLSDANGSFAAATTIGSVSATNSGTINATIPSTTPDGNGYLIRVIGSNPSTLGSDNGAALVVDQFSNGVTPVTAQTFVYTASGSQLTVSESQNSTSREWRASTVSGGPYIAIPAQTAVTYTPSSPSPGIFYVVCASTNQYSDEVLSNEIMITVENGNTINTSAVSGSPYYVSASANNQVSVNFTSDVIFNNGNIFTAQLSDASGNFTSPVNIGTLSATSPAAISATIPNVILDGSGYRIRVVSSNPAVTGTNNGSNLTVINFNVSMSPIDTQYVAAGTPTAPVTFTSTHPNTTVEWKMRTSFIGDYNSFNPLATSNPFIHVFSTPNTYQVVGVGVNTWGDTLQTITQVVFEVVNPGDINELENGGVKAFMSNDQFMVDLTNSAFQNPEIQIINMAGQIVFDGKLPGKAIHNIPVVLAAGIYNYRISENGKTIAGKIPIL